MNISSISNGSNIGCLSLNNNNAIKVLEKQKMQLQDQIQKVNESKLDDKTKQDRVKQLQEQIQQIDMVIQQKRLEKLNQNNDKEQAAADSQSSVNNINGNNAENSLRDMSDLIQSVSSYSNAKLLKNTKSRMQNNIQITKTEIKLDDYATDYKVRELQSMDSKIKSLDAEFAEKIHTAQEHIKKPDKLKNKEIDTIIEPMPSTPDSKGPMTGDAEAAGNKEKEINKNQEATGKLKIYTKVDIKV